MSAPFFSEGFRQRLKLGKYTRWASNLSEAHLEALLWMLGEFGCRSPGLIELLDKHAEDITHGGLIRGRVALESISRIVNGERFDVNEAKRRIWRRRGHLEFNDLPDIVKIAADRASPQTTWDLVTMSEKGYELGGKDAKDRRIGASVTNEGKVIVRTAVAESAVPEAVSAALKEQMPKFDLWCALAVGPDCQTVSYYEFWVSPPNAETQKILVSADGNRVTFLKD